MAAVPALRITCNRWRKSWITHIAFCAVWRALCLGVLISDFASPGRTGASRSKPDKPKQVPLSLMRERAGAKYRAQARDKILPLPLSGAEKKLLRKLKESSRKGRWNQVETDFGSYVGSSSAIYCHVMHAAFRCAQYQRGVEVYNKLCDLGAPKTLPVYTLAIKLFAKTKQPALMNSTWTEALETEGMDGPLAGARIDAAAEEGDVVSAAIVLDQLKSKKLQPSLAHFTSAVLACRSANGINHNAANYLLKLVEAEGLVPDIVFFTALIRAYQRADLGMFTAAYKKMKDFGIVADRVFAETYLGALLLQPGRVRRQIFSDLKRVDRKRLLAAGAALRDFEAANVEMSGLSRAIQESLHRLLDG